MSASTLEEPTFEDLSARARIRDAALRLFAEKGGESATVRDIARAAGVSGGLVRHHFGSKADLRAACDSYALNQLIRFKERVLSEGHVTSPGFGTAARPAILVLFKYFARSMVEGSPAADSMFDEMVELAQSWLAEHHHRQLRDPRAYGALLVAMELGGLTMREQLSRALAADIFEPEGLLRLARAKVEFYSQSLLNEELAAQAHAALDQLELQGHATSKTSRSTRERPGR